MPARPGGNLGRLSERALFQRSMASLKATASAYTKAGDTAEAAQAMLHADTLRKQIEQHNAAMFFAGDDHEGEEE